MSSKNTVRTEMFVGHGIRWTRGGGGLFHPLVMHFGQKRTFTWLVQRAPFQNHPKDFWGALCAPLPIKIFHTFPSGTPPVPLWIGRGGGEVMTNSLIAQLQIVLPYCTIWSIGASDRPHPVDLFAGPIRSIKRAMVVGGGGGGGSMEAEERKGTKLDTLILRES